jgi:hypothetical protein
MPSLLDGGGLKRECASCVCEAVPSMGSISSAGGPAALVLLVVSRAKAGTARWGHWRHFRLAAAPLGTAADYSSHQSSPSFRLALDLSG